MKKIAEILAGFFTFLGVSVLLSYLRGDVDIPDSLLNAGIYSVILSPLVRWITGKQPQKEYDKKDDEKE